MSAAGVPEHARPLTALRFLAALWVLCHHALPQQGPLTTAIGATGWLGVSLFFVLSGFLLTVRYAPDGTLPTTRRTFWLERVARLAPTYLLALAFALPLFVRDARVADHGAGRIAAIAASTVSLQQSWHPALACQWDCPAWSLSVEAWFYFAFPLLVTLVGAWLLRDPAARPGRGAMLLAGAMGASAVVFPWLERASASWPAPVYSLSPLARWPEFVAGMALAALIGTRRPRFAGPGVVALLAGTAWLAVVVTLRGPIMDAGLHLLPPSLPGFVLLVAGCWLLREHPAFGLGAPWLVALGEASYALYLFHAPLHGYLLAAANRVLGRGYDGTWGLFAGYGALAIVLSVAVHRGFERPWRTRLRSRWGLGQRAA